MENSFQQDNSSLTLPMRINLATTISDHSSSSTALASSIEPLYGNSSYTNTIPQNHLPPLLATSASSNDLTDSMEPSLLIGNIFNAMSIKDNSALKKHVTCLCGEGFKAGFFCKNCSEHLCQKCVSAHYRVNLTKTHDIVKVRLDHKLSS